MEMTTFETVCTVFTWWLIGFIPGIWTADASRRHTGRNFPSIYQKQLHWNDLILPAFVSFAGPIALAVHIFVAVIFECGERHWFDFLDRPIFPKKDK